jgi:hypothetical protein
MPTSDQIRAEDSIAPTITLKVAHAHIPKRRLSDLGTAARGRSPAVLPHFHGGNRGSHPFRDANDIKQGRAQSRPTDVAKRLAQARLRKDNSSASGGIFEGGNG